MATTMMTIILACTVACSVESYGNGNGNANGNAVLRVVRVVRAAEFVPALPPTVV